MLRAPTSGFLTGVLLLLGVGAFAGDNTLPCTASTGEDYSSCLARRPGGRFVQPAVLSKLSFDHGLASVWSKGLGWMYANEKGKVLIEGVAAMDNGPDEFHDGLVRVERKGKCGFADRRGKLVVPPAYDGCLNFESKVARVCVKCRSECADKDCEHRELKGGDWFCLNPYGSRVGCAP